MAVIPSRYRAPWQIQNALRYEREDGIPCFSGWGKSLLGVSDAHSSFLFIENHECREREGGVNPPAAALIHIKFCFCFM